MIIDLQRRMAEVGRIRIGQQVPTKTGKTRPEKLSTFRLTSTDRRRIDQAAQLFGGTPQPWEAPAGPAWEVITTVDTLDVLVPPSDMAFSQHYELWSAGGCQRRCDGRTEAISEGPCICDAENRECDIHTRLSLMIRDLPGLGVWRLDSQGWNAALELSGAVDVIQMAAKRGTMLPARLRLEQRQAKRVGVDGRPHTRRFAVPVLDVELTPAQLMGVVSIDQPEQPAPASRPAITPIPASEPPAGPSVAEQLNLPAQPTKPRKNATQPIPATGVKVRTAAEAANPAPNVNGYYEKLPSVETIDELRALGAQASFANLLDEQPAGASGHTLRQTFANRARQLRGEPEPDVQTSEQETGAIANRDQIVHLHALCGEFGLGGNSQRDLRLDTISEIIGRKIGSFNELTSHEANKVAFIMGNIRNQPNKALALEETVFNMRDNRIAEAEHIP